MAAEHDIVVIGAGIGGLAATLRLAAAGRSVTLLEAAAEVGGKIRTLPSAAGPVDAGPTVLTLRNVFDDLFAAAGARLDDHLDLVPVDPQARHFWSDGTLFDFSADSARTAAEAEVIFGRAGARQIGAHSDRARRLLSAFDDPMLRSAEPRVASLAAVVAARPRLLADLAPHKTMAAGLSARFDDPRLAQLYGRYATYVGTSPGRAPALLDLVSDAEARGVWRIEGGMAALPRAIAALAREQGAQVLTGVAVEQLRRDARGWRIDISPGESLSAGTVVFAGDPAALRRGLLGSEVRTAVAGSAVAPRSLSAVVASFAAQATGTDLSYHNVFFSDEVNAEFAEIDAGRLPGDATLYLCALDRGAGPTAGPERFEIILNAPAGLTLTFEERRRCLHAILTRLGRFGLRFDPEPSPSDLTTPEEFATLFPGSEGALYGLRPTGLTSALRRPRARTTLPGLYLAGGGAHPGAGLPMAALSGRHAAEAILKDRAST